MAGIRRDGILKRGNSIKWKEFGSEGILLDPVTGEFVQIDEVGMEIWKRIDGQKTTGEIIEELYFLFDADERVLAGDTILFMEELSSKGLIFVGQ